MTNERQYTNADLARDYLRLVTSVFPDKNIEEDKKIAEVVSKLEIDLPAMYRQYGIIPKLTRYGVGPIARRALLEVLEYGVNRVIGESQKGLVDVLEQIQKDLKQGPKR